MGRLRGTAKKRAARDEDGARAVVVDPSRRLMETRAEIDLDIRGLTHPHPTIKSRFTSQMLLAPDRESAQGPESERLAGRPALAKRVHRARGENPLINEHRRPVQPGGQQWDAHVATGGQNPCFGRSVM